MSSELLDELIKTGSFTKKDVPLLKNVIKHWDIFKIFMYTDSHVESQHYLADIIIKYLHYITVKRIMKKDPSFVIIRGCFRNRCLPMIKYMIKHNDMLGLDYFSVSDENSLNFIPKKLRKIILKKLDKHTTRSIIYLRKFDVYTIKILLNYNFPSNSYICFNLLDPITYLLVSNKRLKNDSNIENKDISWLFQIAVRKRVNKHLSFQNKKLEIILKIFEKIFKKSLFKLGSYFV